MQADLLNKLDQIEALLALDYGLAPSQLAFLPAGEDGLLYTFQSHGQRLIAKIVGFRTGVDGQMLERQLQVIDRLAQTAAFDFVVSPLPKLAGGFVGRLAEYCLVIYPFVEGVLQRDSQTTSRQLNDLGTLIGQLHALDPAQYPALAAQVFSTAEAERLTAIFSQLPKFAGHANLKPVYDLLAPWEQRLRRDVEQCVQLGESLRRANHPQMITHGDLSPGNIIFTPGGQIKIIDWEGIQLGLPEQDVNMFSDIRHLPHFLATYLKVNKRSLQLDALIFFNLTFVLEGVVQRVELLQEEALNEVQRQHELDELAAELHGHQWFDVGVEQIREILKRFD